jgi:hypothetical protein
MKFVAEKIEPGYSLEDAGHTQDGCRAPPPEQSATARRAEKCRITQNKCRMTPNKCRIAGAMDAGALGIP